MISFRSLSLIVGVACVGTVFAQRESAVAANDVVFPEVSLRGYGTVSGKQTTLSGGASLLIIRCESPEKAALLQAKYLSDLSLLPKTTSSQIALGRSGKTAPSRQVEGQGHIVAARKGSEVRILSAAVPAALESALADKEWAGWEFSTKATVPMYLDRWDRWGFRAYYRPWENPPKTYKPAQAKGGYDFLSEFKFAEDMDRIGMVVFTGPNAMDTAGGLNRDVWWDWMVPQTEARGIPLGLNLKIAEGVEALWLTNRYREQMMEPMPQFGGSFFRIGTPYYGGRGTASWNAKEANQIQFDMTENMLRRFKDQPNLVTVLEPHGELKNVAHSIFVEYGPVADAGYRKYLKTRYADLRALNKSWGTAHASWDDVHVQEVASFAGWNADAVDLTGEWKLAYEDLPPTLDTQGGRLLFFTDTNWTKSIPSLPAPKEWFSSAFDDSAWASLQAPGDERSLVIPSRPGVLRRHFSVSPEWLAKHKQVWLYVWDMNLSSTGDKFRAVLNDRQIGEDVTRTMQPHWTAVEVSQHLKADGNVLALRLPKGKLSYRVYLSGEEPHGYPYFDQGRNAQWYDFAMWHRWMRKEAVRHGLEMIRKVHPNQQVVQMAPDAYADDIKDLAGRYGSNFHNTGYMSAFWADYLPSLMRGTNLPTSLEPGGPARDLKQFKTQQGLWLTEGIQAVDYFIHIGSIMWNAEIRAHFEKNLPLFRLLGKYHVPKAEVAAFYSTENTRLNGFPWILDPNKNLPSGYWRWNVRANLRDYYPSDGLSDTSFASGDAAAYRVIIDTNTSIMSERTLADVEKYVRDGGTFVTFVQTGRHATTQADAWPISRLTGYAVEKIDAMNDNGSVRESGRLAPAPGQTVLAGEWDGVRANGLHLRKVADDAQNVLLWQDGSVALGVRRIGKGYIVHVGCKFTGDSIPDRIDAKRRDAASLRALPANGTDALTNLLAQLMEWRGVAPLPFSWEADRDGALVRHYVSNNGLYDIWTFWNPSDSAAIQGRLGFAGKSPAWCVDLLDKASLPTIDGVVSIDLKPLESRAVMTPRSAINQAPANWFALQRNWWRGTTRGDEPPAEPVNVENTHNLADGWALRVVNPGEDVAALVAPTTDSTAWKKVRLGAWPTAEWPEPKTVVLRRSFTVPQNWKGDVTLTFESNSGSYFAGEGEAYLDGKKIHGKTNSGLDGFTDASLKPGSTHELAFVITSTGTLSGVRGDAWLWLWPEPAARVDLAGEWSESADALRWTGSVRFPGNSSAFAMKRTATIPATFPGVETPHAYLDIDSGGKIIGALVNGRFVRRYHRITTDRFQLNVTPWIRFGEENQIELIRHWDEARGGEVRSIGLNIYPKPY